MHAASWIDPEWRGQKIGLLKSMRGEEEHDFWTYGVKRLANRKTQIVGTFVIICIVTVAVDLCSFYYLSATIPWGVNGLTVRTIIHFSFYHYCREGFSDVRHGVTDDAPLNQSSESIQILYINPGLGHPTARIFAMAKRLVPFCDPMDVRDFPDEQSTNPRSMWVYHNRWSKCTEHTSDRVAAHSIEEKRGVQCSAEQ